MLRARQLQSAEQRLCHPLLQECFQADFVHACLEHVVGFTTSGHQARVVDARVGPDDDQSLDQVRVHQREMQTGPAAQAVADIGSGAADGRQHVGCAAQVGAYLGGVAVAGHIDDGDEESVSGEVLSDWLPRVAGLGEAMDEGHSRSALHAELLGGQRP